ncbi:MAG: glycosyltransferase family 2 protein [Bacteroidia bacterium]|nr:glycosyltransferase family 2 protein [Bacteroidia bacterium]
MMTEGVSIIICCYNSYNRIEATLTHLQAQSTDPDIPWEIILVDNNSTDGSSTLAGTVWKKNQVTQLSIVSEAAPGLMNARIRGVKESKFSIISFIDDDNWIASDWVNRVFSVFREHPDVAACGPTIEPVFESQQPDWFEEYKNAFAVGPQNTESGPVAQERNYLWGAGLSIRRRVWDELFNTGFPALLRGRTGKSWTAGEDSEMCLSIRLLGYTLWYDADLQLKHYLPASRMQADVLSKMFEGFGKAEVVLSLYRNLVYPEKYKIKSSWQQEFLSLSTRFIEFIIRKYKSSGKEGFRFRLLVKLRKSTLQELWNVRSNYPAIRDQIYLFAQAATRKYQERSGISIGIGRHIPLDPGKNVPPVNISIYGVGRSGTKAFQLYTSHVLSLLYGSVRINYEPLFWINRKTREINYEGYFHHTHTPHFITDENYQLSPGIRRYLRKLSEGNHPVVTKFIRANGRIPAFNKTMAVTHSILVIRNIYEVLGSLGPQVWDFWSTGFDFKIDTDAFMKELEASSLLDDFDYCKKNINSSLDYNAMYWYAMNTAALKGSQKNTVIIRYKDFRTIREKLSVMLSVPHDDLPDPSHPIYTGRIIHSDLLMRSNDRVYSNLNRLNGMLYKSGLLEKAGYFFPYKQIGSIATPSGSPGTSPIGNMSLPENLYKIRTCPLYDYFQEKIDSLMASKGL